MFNSNVWECTPLVMFKGIPNVAYIFSPTISVETNNFEYTNPPPHLPYSLIQARLLFTYS